MWMTCCRRSAADERRCGSGRLPGSYRPGCDRGDRALRHIPVPGAGWPLALRQRLLPAGQAAVRPGRAVTGDHHCLRHLHRHGAGAAGLQHPQGLWLGAGGRPDGSLTLLRELGPVVTALLFAGRAGSALTAEIGLMKATEQLSSLEMIGFDPLKYIIAPRLWAGFIAMPLLALIFCVVGIWGGAMVAVDWLGVYSGSYWANMQNSVQFGADVLNGLIKAVVFAAVVTWIAVFQGYDCEPTSEGISRATTRTVVYASLAVLGLDFILTALMF